MGVAMAKDIVIYNGSYSTKVVEIYKDGDFAGAWEIGSERYLILDIGYNSCYSYEYKVRGGYKNSFGYDCSADVTYK